MSWEKSQRQCMGLQFTATAGTGGIDLGQCGILCCTTCCTSLIFSLELLDFIYQSLWRAEGLVTLCQRLTPSFPSHEGALKPVPRPSAGAAPSAPPPMGPVLWWVVIIHGGAAAAVPGLLSSPWRSSLAAAVPPHSSLKVPWRNYFSMSDTPGKHPAARAEQCVCPLPLLLEHSEVGLIHSSVNQEDVGRITDLIAQWFCHALAMQETKGSLWPKKASLLTGWEALLAT